MWLLLPNKARLSNQNIGIAYGSALLILQMNIILVLAAVARNNIAMYFIYYKFIAN